MSLRIDPDMAMTFLDFVKERHLVWDRRLAMQPAPWTNDPILAARKFTNVFRWLDPGSQFVLTDLLGDDPTPEDFLLRCFLYRHTGRVEAWEYLGLTVGYPTSKDLDAVLGAWKTYRGEPKVSTRGAGDRGAKGGQDKLTFSRPIFTGAYLVFPQSTTPGTDKLESIIALTQRLVDNGSFARFVAAKTQADRFAALRANKGVADFMSMQTLTDFGYSTDYREDEFVVCGPGATRGAAHVAPGAKPEAVVAWAQEAIAGLPDPPIVFHPEAFPAFFLPSSMDVQNCLCEFSKYVRYMGKDHPKPYKPAHPGKQPDLVVPPKW